MMALKWIQRDRYNARETLINNIDNIDLAYIEYSSFDVKRYQIFLLFGIDGKDNYFNWKLMEFDSLELAKRYVEDRIIKHLLYLVSIFK